LLNQLISNDEIYREIFVEPGELAKKIAGEYGYLPYMIQRYMYMLGVNDTYKLLEAFEKQVKPVIRTNTLLVEPRKLYSRLSDLGFILEEIRWAPYSFRVIESPDSPTIGSTHEYLKGYYYVHRDPATLIPSIILVHGFRGDVLDCCAAPGGKATHIAQLLNGEYHVYANDLVLYRLRALIGHILRMKLGNIIVTWSDARKLPSLLNKRFERIILDVPCSGEGTIMIDKTRKTKTRQSDLARMVKREIELLWSGLELLEYDGLLVYTTCSIAPEENEYVVSKVIELRNDIEIVDPPVKLFNWSRGLTSFHRLKFVETTSRCIRVWPHLHGMIGLTICIITKTRR